MPYTEAVFTCRGRNANATLASIHSREEEELLVAIARRDLNGKKGHQWVWLGSNKQENASFSDWVDGTPFRYTNWYEGAGYTCPDVDPGRDCVAMGIFAEKEGSTWCNFDCTRNVFTWFCQIVVEPGTYSGLERSMLGDGERLPYDHGHDSFEVGNMSLTLFPDPMSGEEAPLLCPFGEMITLHSKAEQDMLINYLVNNASISRPVLIGVKRNGTGADASNFFWADGSAMDFVGWARYEPNFNRRNEYCTILDLEARGWRDVPCTEKYHLLCDQYALDEGELGLGAWLVYNYFRRGAFSLLVWLLTLTGLAVISALIVVAYIKCRAKVSLMAAEFNHETPVYCDIRKQGDCQCFTTNMYDT